MEFNNEKKEREYQEQQRKREIERERDAELHRRIEAERDEQHRRIEAERRNNEFERERLERMPFWRNVGRSDEAIPFTAQNLINAIITENIQKPAAARDRFLLVSLLIFLLLKFI